MSRRNRRSAPDNGIGDPALHGHGAGVVRKTAQVVGHQFADSFQALVLRCCRSGGRLGGSQTTKQEKAGAEHDSPHSLVCYHFSRMHRLVTIRRPLLHAACGALALLLRWLTPREALLLASAGCVFNLIFMPALAPSLYRRSEDHVERNATSGIFLYPLSVLLLVALVPLHIAATC